MPGPAPDDNNPAKEPLTKSLPEKKSTGGCYVGLSAEQERVLRMVVDDERNIFFTGSAG